MSFSLKEFRESKLKMTQSEFASLIGVRQDAVSRMEQSPEKINFDMLIKIATATGVTLDDLVGYKKPVAEPIKIEYTWGNVEFIKTGLLNYINDNYRTSDFNSLNDSGRRIEDLKSSILDITQKPKVAFVGRSDVGKSTMINSIIGKNHMPTAWTPTTSIIVHIKHASDKPDFIEEDVTIFGSPDGGVWDVDKLHDKDYFMNWKLASGGLDLLKSYGTRQGDKYGEGASVAVVFLDSDILKNCDLIDLPGYGTGDRLEDNTMTLEEKNKADVLIYLCTSNAFMRDEDIEYIKESLDSLKILNSNGESKLKPLSNLFIVATQSHVVDGGNPISLKTVLDGGHERFNKTLTDNFWERFNDVFPENYSNVFRERFFTYTADIPTLRENFDNSLREILEVIPCAKEYQIKNLIENFKKNQSEEISKIIKEYSSILKDQELYRTSLLNIKYDQSSYTKRENQKQEIFNLIKKLKDENIEEFSRSYHRNLNEDNIVSVIEKKGYRKKKEDVTLLTSYIGSVLKEIIEKMLKRSSLELSGKIDSYIGEFERTFEFDSVEFENFKFTTFNPKQAFASGLAGLATFGGLAIWASTLGNLGAYIIVAKGVSLLSAIGISVGGTAAAISAVAAIGGPIVLGIGLSILAALSAFGILSGNWQKSLAKKIVSAYEKEDILSKYEKVITDFWEDTEKAFEKASRTLELEWKNYIDSESMLLEEKSDSESKINKKISQLNIMKYLIENIPDFN